MMTPLLRTRVSVCLAHVLYSVWTGLPMPVQRGLVRWADQVVYLLEYEPSWFGEFALALGATLWGVFALLTSDLQVIGAARILPCLAITGGILRCVALLVLSYPGRVILAAASALLWAFLFWGLLARYEAAPMLGPLLGMFVFELLTGAKFSLPCARDLYSEFRQAIGLE